jgi:hypothetical protein
LDGKLNGKLEEKRKKKRGRKNNKLKEIRANNWGEGIREKMMGWERETKQNEKQ